jgi:hypothetical protein
MLISLAPDEYNLCSRRWIVVLACSMAVVIYTLRSCSVTRSTFDCQALHSGAVRHQDSAKSAVLA